MQKDVRSNSKKIEEYIHLAPENQKVLLLKIRNIILESDFELIEDWKWGPNYSYHGMVCGFAYFKKHIKINFFNGAFLQDKHQLFNYGFDNKHNRGINIPNGESIQEKHFAALLKEACLYNQKNNTRNLSIIRPKSQQIMEIPTSISDFLKAYPKELSYLESLPHTHKKEYIKWILEAKKEETKQRRLEKMLQMLQSKKHL
ncbi:MAG: YdeI/OmpD-associated family protein [Bacteroidota bacterium]